MADDKGIDYARGWLWLIKEGDLIPPFCVEVILKDGSRYYLHSVCLKDEQTKSMTLRIWDLRALSQKDIEELKEKLNNVINRELLAKEGGVHPKLDWGNLRINLDEILYCIEWHDRIWPDEERPKIGFK